MLFKSLTALFTSDCLDPILAQFSKAVLLAVNGDRSKFISDALRDLVKLGARPQCLTVFAYEWCSAIYGNREKFEDWESLLLACLETGFRHLNARQPYFDIELTHTEHHWGLVDVVLKSQKSEVIADLLRAWTLRHPFPRPADTLVDICAGHLVGLHNLVQFSPRLRQLVIHFIGNAGYKRFKGAGVEKLTELLDHLQVTVEDVDEGELWMSLLLDVVGSSQGTQHLSHWYWELLVELALVTPEWPIFVPRDSPEITKSLVEAQELDKFECWIGLVWLNSWEWDVAGVTEEDLENWMLLLFRQRPGATQKLKEWMERGNQRLGWDIPESFQRICERAHEAAQGQDAP